MLKRRAVMEALMKKWIAAFALFATAFTTISCQRNGYDERGRDRGSCNCTDDQGRCCSKCGCSTCK